MIAVFFGGDKLKERLDGTELPCLRSAGEAVVETFLKKTGNMIFGYILYRRAGNIHACKEGKEFPEIAPVRTYGICRQRTFQTEIRAKIIYMIFRFPVKRHGSSFIHLTIKRYFFKFTKNINVFMLNFVIFEKIET
jgi:hypothetical protein